MTSTREHDAPHDLGHGGEPLKPDQWVARFGRTERFAHWWTVLMLGAAILTGLGMGDDARSGALCCSAIAGRCSDRVVSCSASTSATPRGCATACGGARIAKVSLRGGCSTPARRYWPGRLVYRSPG